MPVSKNNDSAFESEVFEYPTGMVWCPMKRSGMAIMRCARLQRELGCGTRRDFHALKTSDPHSVLPFWPWLRRRPECPERATEKQVREILLLLTDLKLVDRSRKNPKTLQCPACGGRKSFGARRCRRCWNASVKATPAHKVNSRLIKWNSRPTASPISPSPPHPRQT